MKRILFIILAIFATSICVKAQVTTSGTTGHYDVLTCYNNGAFSTGVVKILTNIPASSVTNTTVYIKGFDAYGEAATINLQVSWSNYGGDFDQYIASSSGARVPDIWIGIDPNNKTVLYLTNLNLFDTRFEITAFANGHGENSAWYTGWSIADEDANYAWYQIPCSNSFGNVMANSMYAGYLSTYSHYSTYSSNSYLYATSKLGVGTSSPLGKMQVKGTQGEWDGPTRMYLTNNASLYGRTNFILTGRFDNYNDSWQFGSNARNSIVFAMNEAGATGSEGTEKYSIQLEGNSKSLGFLSQYKTNTPTMVLTQDGSVGIGTVNPKAMLSVNGNVLAKEVKVSIATSDWPDYVFDHSYRLRPLTELESFIKKNRHLPGVPSAQQVGENGVDLGSNQTAILQKVEELTLYIIEQDKKVKQLEEKLNKLLADKK